MKILVVGGTGFLGGAIARRAAMRNHEVSILSRGKKPLGDIRGVNYIIGDRLGNLSELKGMGFDAVADTSAFAPWHVSSLLDALSVAPSTYAMISSINVYGTHTHPQMDETAATPRAKPEHFEAARRIPLEAQCDGASYGEEYGPLKRESEIVAVEQLGNSALILRAGLLVGAGDYTDRLTYWVRRTYQGGEFAAPGSPRRLVQLIDVADVANFILDSMENRQGGIFNMTGSPFAFGELIAACIATAKSNGKPRWIADERIASAGIAGWTDLPLWLNASDKDFEHFLNTSIQKALVHGLKFRPLAETLNEVLQWDRARRHIPLKCGLSKAREALVLE